MMQQQRMRIHFRIPGIPHLLCRHRFTQQVLQLLRSLLGTPLVHHLVAMERTAVEGVEEGHARVPLLCYACTRTHHNES